MPDPNHQSLLLIVDRGAETAAFEHAQLAGLQNLLQSLHSEPGLTTVTMVQFDDEARVTTTMGSPSSVWIEGSPHGGGALYDAIAKGVTTQRQAIASLPEHARPWAVQVLVVSDGEDSASREFDADRLEGLFRDLALTGHWNLNVVPVTPEGRTPTALSRLQRLLSPRVSVGPIDE